MKDTNMTDDQHKVQSEDERDAPRISSRSTQPKLVKLVITNSDGFIKNEQQARKTLFVIAIVAVVISIFLFVSATSDRVSEQYRYNEEEYDRALDPEEPA